MQINLSTRHRHLSTETQEKLKSKLEKLPRYLDRIVAVHVTIDLEHDESPGVEIRVAVPRSPDFVARETGDGLKASFDGALHKIAQQLRRFQEKATSHRATGRRHEAVPPEEQEQEHDLHQDDADPR